MVKSAILLVGDGCAYILVGSWYMAQHAHRIQDMAACYRPGPTQGQRGLVTLRELLVFVYSKSIPISWAI